MSLLARRLEELLHDYISELEQAQREILRGDTHALRRIKPMNYIIITDGVPSKFLCYDRNSLRILPPGDSSSADDPEAVIIQAARRLDRGNLPVSQVRPSTVLLYRTFSAMSYLLQVGIQFVQVGDDPRATEALRELDDELAKEYGIRVSRFIYPDRLTSHACFALLIRIWLTPRHTAVAHWTLSY